jgi:predicted extracellular nuclease
MLTITTRNVLSSAADGPNVEDEFAKWLAAIANTITTLASDTIAFQEVDETAIGTGSVHAPITARFVVARCSRRP